MKSLLYFITDHNIFLPKPFFIDSRKKNSFLLFLNWRLTVLLTQKIFQVMCLKLSNKTLKYFMIKKCDAKEHFYYISFFRTKNSVNSLIYLLQNRIDQYNLSKMFKNAAFDFIILCELFWKYPSIEAFLILKMLVVWTQRIKTCRKNKSINLFIKKFVPKLLNEDLIKKFRSGNPGRDGKIWDTHIIIYHKSTNKNMIGSTNLIKKIFCCRLIEV